MELPNLPRDMSLIAMRLAVEGVPIAAIARAIGHPSSDVRDTLEYHLEIGSITEMPIADWPPTARRSDHMPAFLQKEPEKIQLFSCQRALGLTRLEAGFMLVLLKREEADKETLHFVIETQRALRRTRPDSVESTDVKMVDVVICKLRKKLKLVNAKIDTLWGHGYYLDEKSRDTIEALLLEVKISGSNSGI
jgi:hypothetical protein